MPAGNPTAATVIQKRDPKESSRAATTAALPANTRAGNVLTADVNGALPAIDGVTLAVSDPVERVLVKNEAAGANNGIYDVTDLGSGSTKWVLTRSVDFDSDEKVTSGAFTFASEGTANAGKEFSLLTADPIIVNTTILTFSQTGGAGGDADAIHDNVAAEISAIDEKVATVGDDLVVLEDSEDGNKKVRAKISSLGAGLHPVVDTTELVKGSGDATKRIRFEVDGLTTATLRVITAPDKDITLDDDGDARPPTAHASDHTDGTDDIQNATAAQKGLATATQITKLDGIATGADVTGSNAPQAHATSHENGGSDEINVDGLSGLLADAQTPAAHTHTHASTTGQGTDDHHAKLHAGDHVDGTDDIQSATSGQKGLATAAQITKLDGIEAAATADQTNAEIESAYNAQVAIVTQPEAEAGTVTDVRRWTPERVRQAIASLAFPSFQFYADQLENPNNADWDINALAPAVADSNNNGQTVRLFDDTVEEGVGFSLEVPLGAVNMKLKYRVRAETGPAGAVVAKWNLRERGFPDAAAVDAWSAAIQLADSALPITTEFFHYDEDEKTLATWGLVAGQIHQFEFTRDALDAGDTLVGDAALLEIIAEFS